AGQLGEAHDLNGVHADAFFAGFLGGLDGIAAAVVETVGDDDHDAGLGLALLEDTDALEHAVADGGAGLQADLAEDLGQPAGIGGERREQEDAAAETDQTGAVLGAGLDELVDGLDEGLHARHLFAALLVVARAHRSGDVAHEGDIDAEAMVSGVAALKPRAGEGDDYEN